MPNRTLDDVVLDEHSGRLFLAMESPPQGTSLPIHHVYTVDVESGKLVRTISVGGNAGDLILDDDHARVLLLGGQSNATFGPALPGGAYLYLLDDRTGALIYTTRFTASAYQNASITLDGTNGQAFVPTADGLSVYSTSDGSLERTLPITSATLLVDEPTQRLMAAGYGALRFFDLHTGAPVYTATVDLPPSGDYIPMSVFRNRGWIG